MPDSGTSTRNSGGRSRRSGEMTIAKQGQSLARMNGITRTDMTPSLTGAPTRPLTLAPARSITTMAGLSPGTGRSSRNLQSEHGRIWRRTRSGGCHREDRAAAERGELEPPWDPDLPPVQARELSPEVQADPCAVTIDEGQFVPTDCDLGITGEPQDEREGPTERRLMDWHIHNDHADGLEYDREAE